MPLRFSSPVKRNKTPPYSLNLPVARPVEAAPPAPRPAPPAPVQKAAPVAPAPAGKTEASKPSVS